MPDERPMEDAMEPRGVARGRPKRVRQDAEPAAEGAVAASDVNETARPKQLN